MSFLDKFQITGYNIDGGSTRFRLYGEGLYLQFYHRIDDQIYEFAPAPTRGAEHPPERYELTNSSRLGLRLFLNDSAYHPSSEDTPRRGNKFKLIMDPHYRVAAVGESPTISDVEYAWNDSEGFPVAEYETTWGDIKEALPGASLPSNVTPDSLSNSAKIKVMDFMKARLSETDNFRIMFEYAFPVRKMFNFMQIQMDQYVSAFLLNTSRRGAELKTNEEDESFKQLEDLEIRRDSILGASAIDPEQFMEAKKAVKSILENVANSDNYRYISSEIEEAGGQGKLAFKKQLKN